jgi:hypothetical protein
MKLARKYARIAHVRRDALHKGTSLLTRAPLPLEERAARKVEIAAALPEPKTKGVAKKGKRSQPTESPPLPENIARKVKEKQIKKQLRQATLADAPLRPLMVILEDLNVDGMKRNRHLALAISDVGLGEFKRQRKRQYSLQTADEKILRLFTTFPSPTVEQVTRR